jgi:hypothetical protein
MLYVSYVYTSQRCGAATGAQLVEASLPRGAAQVPWTPISTSPKIGIADAFFLGIFDKWVAPSRASPAGPELPAPQPWPGE